MECRLLFKQPLLLQLRPHCIFSFRTVLEEASQPWIFEAKTKNMQNSDTDLCFFLLTLYRTESLWHPVSSPHNLIINWQYTLIAKSLSQGPKQEAQKRDEVCAVQELSPTTIKTLLIKMTWDTNHQLKCIAFIILIIKNSQGRLMS